MEQDPLTIPVKVENDLSFIECGFERPRVLPVVQEKAANFQTESSENHMIRKCQQTDGMYKFKVQRTGDIDAAVDIDWSCTELKQFGVLNFAVNQKEAFGNVILDQLPCVEPESVYLIEISNIRIAELPMDREYPPETLLTEKRQEFTIQNNIPPPIIGFGMKEITANRSHRFLYIPLIRAGFLNSPVTVETEKGSVIFEAGESTKNLKIDFDLSPQKSDVERFSVKILKIDNETSPYFPQIDENKDEITVILTNDVIRPIIFCADQLIEIQQSDGFVNVRLSREGWTNSVANVEYRLISPSFPGIFDFNESKSETNQITFNVGDIEKSLRLPLSKIPQHMQILEDCQLLITKVSGENYPEINENKKSCQIIIKLDLEFPILLIAETDEIVQVNRSEGQAVVRITRKGPYLEEKSSFILVRMEENESKNIMSSSDDVSLVSAFRKNLSNCSQEIDSSYQLHFEPGQKTLTQIIKFHKKPQNSEFSELVFELRKKESVESMIDSFPYSIDQDRLRAIVWILNDIKPSHHFFEHDKISCRQTDGSFTVQLRRDCWQQNISNLSISLESGAYPPIVIGEVNDLDLSNIEFNIKEETKDLVFELSDLPEMAIGPNKNLIRDRSYLTMILDNVSGPNFPTINQKKARCTIEIIHEIFESEISFKEQFMSIKQSCGKIQIAVMRKNYVGEAEDFHFKFPDGQKVIKQREEDQFLNFKTGQTQKIVELSIETNPILSDLQGENLDSSAGSMSQRLLVELINQDGDKVDQLMLNIELDVEIPKASFGQQKICVLQSEKFVTVDIYRDIIFPNFVNAGATEKVILLIDNTEEHEITFEKDQLKAQFNYKINQAPNDEPTTIINFCLLRHDTTPTLTVDINKNLLEVEITNDNKYTEFSFDSPEYEYDQSEKTCMIPVHRIGDVTSLAKINIKIVNKLLSDPDFKMSLGTKNLVFKPQEFCAFVTLNFPSAPIFDDQLLYFLEILPDFEVSAVEDSNINSNYTPVGKLGKFKSSVISINSDIEIGKIGFDLKNCPKTIKRSEVARNHGKIDLPLVRSGYDNEQVKLDLQHKTKIIDLKDEIKSRFTKFKEIFSELTMDKRQNKISYQVPVEVNPIHGSHESLNVELMCAEGTSKPEIVDHSLTVKIINDIPHPEICILDSENDSNSKDRKTYLQSESTQISFELLRKGWKNSTVFFTWTISCESLERQDLLDQNFIEDAGNHIYKIFDNDYYHGESSFAENQESLQISINLADYPIAKKIIDRCQFKFEITKVFGNFEPFIEEGRDFQKFAITLDILPPVYMFDYGFGSSTSSSNNQKINFSQNEHLDLKILKNNYLQFQSILDIEIFSLEFEQFIRKSADLGSFNNIVIAKNASASKMISLEMNNRPFNRRNEVIEGKLELKLKENQELGYLNGIVGSLVVGFTRRIII